MSGDVAGFAQVMVIVIVSCVAFVAIGLGAWRAAVRMKQQPVAPRADDRRLDRLEAAVDAIAVEVERISESQRYTVNLLSERLPTRQADRIGELPSPTGGKRIPTPH